TINTGIVIKADQTALSENFTTVLEQVEVNDKPLFEVQELSEVSKGYQTDIASIKISEKEMAFTFKNGTTKRSNYRYVGKEILTY
ncbi:ZinT/AdcA family metal-binding protein, partial [Enterococcus faecium]|uniref:ZinT/AdcA family metal-binding protein n=1 Tax=Enterococcus faecium TaxID=1352 RepID=UPI00292EE3CC